MYCFDHGAILVGNVISILRPRRQLPTRRSNSQEQKTGVVILRDNLAVKIPEIRQRMDYNLQPNIRPIRHEQSVYRRLGKFDGVVPCISFPGPVPSSLSWYRLPTALQISWFLHMADALADIHDRRALVADIASRNFSLAAALTITLYDSAESSILPLGTEMNTANDDR